MNDTWTTCGPRQFLESTYEAVNDNCPSEFWLEVRHFGRFTCDLDHSVMGLKGYAENVNSDDISGCENTHVHKEVYLPSSIGTWALLGQSSEQNYWEYFQEYCKHSSIEPQVELGDVTGDVDKVLVRMQCMLYDAPTDCIAELAFTGGCPIVE